MQSSMFKFIFTNNIYDHNPKLDDWARNVLNSNLEIKPEQRGTEFSTEYYVVVDGVYVWVALDWAAFSVHAMKSISYGHGTPNFKMAMFDSSVEARLGRPRLDLAIRLWWKIKKFRKEWENI